MADKIHVFISYATKDAGFVNVLRKDLAAQGIIYWIDKEGLRPGTINWEKGIRQALRDAFAVIYVVTPASYASDNVQGEIAIAEVEGCTIYPIWADGDKWHDCVPIDKVKTQYIDMRGDKYELNRQVLFNALGGKRPDLVMPAPTAVTLPAGVTPRNPYKGLNAFTERDVADFFGRDKLITELLQAVNARIQDRKDLFLTVIGASGSGKSSVVMAGLLPRLKAGKDISGSDQWTYLKPMVPGDHPVQALAKVLYSAPGRTLSNKVIDEDLSHPNGIGLLTTAETLPQHPVVLYIDQFEELFMTGVPEEERQQFINLLINAVTQIDSPVLVLLTMRADFYDRPMNYPELGRLVQSYNRSVLPMSIADLRNTVEKPAAAAGLSFEAGLISDIIFDLRDDKNAQAGALPLLQYTLEQLYERRVGNTLTAAAYQEIGGVKGAIGAHAEEVFKTLDEEAQNAFARVFQALVHVDERGTPTRKREIESVLTSQSASSRLVEALINHARVLRVDTEKLGEIPYVEVAHEALLTSWGRLVNWIKDVEKDIRVIQEMKLAVQSWVDDGYSTDHLLTERRLQPIRDALQRLPQTLNHDQKVFTNPTTKGLFDYFLAAPEDIQIRIINNEFLQVGKPVVPILVEAYSNKVSERIEYHLTNFLLANSITLIKTMRLVLNTENKLVLGCIKLIKYFRIEGFLNFLIAALKSNLWDVQVAAAETIGTVGDNTTLPAMLEALQDSDVYVRVAVTDALINMVNSNFEIALSVLRLDCSDDHIRLAAVKALKTIDDTRVMPTLLKMLNDIDWNIRISTVEALCEFQDEQALFGILQALKDIDEKVRVAAVEVLGRYRDERAVRGLLEASRDVDRKVRTAAVKALGECQDELAIPGLLEAVWDDEPEARISAVRALGKLQNEQTLSELLKLLWDNDNEVRIAAVRALGERQDEKALPELLKLLWDNDNKVRIAAVRALGERQNEQALSELLKILWASDPRLRIEAVNVLGKYRDEQVLPALLEVAKNVDRDVRWAAVRVLRERQDERVLPVLLEALNTGDKYIRQSALFGIRAFGYKGALTELLKLLDDEDLDIRIGAVKTFKYLRYKDDERVVAKLLEKLEDREPAIQLAAVEVLGEYQGEKVVLRLLQALEDKDRDIRKAAVKSLGRIDDWRVVPALLRSLKDINKHVREAAVEALSSNQNEPVVSGLLEALNDNAPNVQQAAAIALRENSFSYQSIIPVLLDMMNSNDSQVRFIAIVALREEDIEREEVLVVMLNMLNDDNESVREIVFEALCNSKDWRAIWSALDVLEDNNQKMRNLASAFLGKVKSQKAIPRLIELLSHPFGIVSKPARQALELMDIPESRAALAEYDAKHKG